MPTLDIPISADLNGLLELPPCDELKLPLPEKVKIKLPTGGTLQAFTDISKGIPNDCSMTFNLLVQIAPLLASMECLVKILVFLKSLLDVVPGPPTPAALQKFAKATAGLAECFLVPTPANIIPFVRDILCLILKVLNCVIGQLKTILAVLSGVTLQLSTARAAGNTELEQALQCAQENAQISAQHLTASMEPLGVILDLVGPLMGIAGVQPIQMPTLGSNTDLASLNSTLEAIQGVAGVIQIVVDALGGCSS
jgi:hypothetical protein